MGESEEIKGRFLTIRLSSQDKVLLEKAANNCGLSASQYIRKIIFPDTENTTESAEKTSKSTDSDLLHRMAISSKGLRSEFKRMVEYFGEFTADFSRHLKENSSLILLRRDIDSLNNTVVDLQKLLNQNLSLFNEQEVHLIAKVNTAYNVQTPEQPSGDEVKSKDDRKPITLETLKYYYMEKVTITGTIIDSPKDFTTKNGYRMIGFHVSASKQKAGKEKKTVYEVTLKYDEELIARLQQDMSVVVVGDLDVAINEANGKSYLNCRITDPTINIL